MGATVSASLDHVAELLEAAARELRNLAGSSKGDLDPLREGEAECGRSPTMPHSPDPGVLMRRHEVAELLRVDLRTLDRWRADPTMKFPEAVRRGRVLRWKRTSIERWLASRAT